MVARPVPEWVLPACGIAILLVAWEIVGRTAYVDSGIIPPPTRIVQQVRLDGFDFYWRNTSATLGVAAKGWLLGNGAAILLALLAIVVPYLEKPLLQLGLTSYCVPSVAIASILVVVFADDMPKIIVAAMQVFFVTLVGAIVGLRSADAASLDVVHAYGGGRLDQLRKVRIRACQPVLFATLRIAAPAAVIGAIIGEYLGSERGLGVAMINSQQGLLIERTWALCIIATACAGIGYALTSVVGRVLTPWAPRDGR